jgi:hypothetical protein
MEKEWKILKALVVRQRIWFTNREDHYDMGSKDAYQWTLEVMRDIENGDIQSVDGLPE